MYALLMSCNLEIKVFEFFWPECLSLKVIMGIVSQE